jgi:hypothetical protein
VTVATKNKKGKVKTFQWYRNRAEVRSAAATVRAKAQVETKSGRRKSWTKMRLGHATEMKTKSESGVKHELEMKSGRGLLVQIKDNTPVLLQTQNLSKKRSCARDLDGAQSLHYWRRKIQSPSVSFVAQSINRSPLNFKAQTKKLSR